jgi:hypothetical protein
MIAQYVRDESLFGLSFDEDQDSLHDYPGRPPRTFLSHRSPSE